MDDLNRQVYQKIMQHKNNNARNASFGCATDQGGVITLPVVVHIIDSSGVTIANNAQYYSDDQKFERSVEKGYWRRG